MKMTPSKLLNIVLATMLIASALFMTTAKTSTQQTTSTGYDPWLDSDDDGDIDLYDVVRLLVIYGVKGTPINKTALLLDLQERLDTLNASVIGLLSMLISLEDAVDLLETDVLALQSGLTDLQTQLIDLEAYINNVANDLWNDIISLEMGLVMVNGLIADLTTRVTALETRVDTIESTVAELLQNLDGMKFGKSYSYAADINPIVTCYSGYVWWDFSEKALKVTETNAYNGYCHLSGIRNQAVSGLELHNTWIDPGETETVAVLSSNGHWATFEITSEGPDAGYIHIHVYYSNLRFVAHYSYRYQ